MTWNILLSPWPYKSQNASPTTDGQPDENHADNCGETCLSMIVEFLTGVKVDPDTIKDQILGQGTLGLLDTYQLTGYLWRQTGTNTSVIEPPDQNSLTHSIWQYTVIGEPLLVLRQYSPTVTNHHWVVVIGLTPTQVVYVDPWVGQPVWQSYADFYALFRSMLIGVERTRDANLV